VTSLRLCSRAPRTTICGSSDFDLVERLRGVFAAVVAGVAVERVSVAEGVAATLLRVAPVDQAAVAVVAQVPLALAAPQIEVAVAVVVPKVIRAATVARALSSFVISSKGTALWLTLHRSTTTAPSYKLLP
jgi:hypothetical protein